jgi:hypothetical protein
MGTVGSMEQHKVALGIVGRKVCEMEDIWMPGHICGSGFKKSENREKKWQG